MDWPTYKRLCDQPDHWSRWMLEQCTDLLGQLQEDGLVGALQRALSGQALATPVDHQGGQAVQIYVLRLPLDQRREICRAIEQAVSAGLSTAQTKSRGLGGFVEAWQEYVAYEEPVCTKS
jgi:hypothetical protein